MNKKCQTVAVLGASPKPERYSNRAVRMLKEHGHRVIPVHPRMDTIEGLPVFHRLEDIHEPVDTLSVYVGPDRSLALIDSIIKLKPGRVILNPDTPSEAIEKKLTEAGIPYLEACTLVMLTTNQF